MDFPINAVAKAFIRMDYSDSSSSRRSSTSARSSNDLTIDEEILKAEKHLETLQQKKAEQSLAVEGEIAAVAEEIEKIKEEQEKKNLEEHKDLVEATEKCQNEQLEKQENDKTAAEKVNVTTKSDHLMEDQKPTVILSTMTERYDLLHTVLRQGIAAEIKLLKATEHLEKESHKQKLRHLEMHKKLIKAEERLEKERYKKFERERELDAKIKEAADIVLDLRKQQEELTNQKGDQ